MLVTLVYVHVKKDNLEEFILQTENNHRESIKEPGNLRFDILQDASDPCRFTFYEAYISEEAIAAHKLTPHYQEWRDAVDSWMAEPRRGMKHNILFPENMNNGK